MPAIRKVGVIGAGVMGSAIAAQVANAGFPVLLLDVVPEGTPTKGTPEGAPIKGTPEGAPIRGTPEGAPIRGTPEGTPIKRGPEGTPAKATPDDAPSMVRSPGTQTGTVTAGEAARAAPSGRSAIAEAAVARMLKTEPAPFMSPRAAKLIETGNIEDDLPGLAACDWIIEAVIERLEVKQALYHRLLAVCRPGTAISSNTSTIPLARLLDGMPEAFARDFFITHFFNPPRYMRLLELVAGPATDPALVAAVAEFSDVALGKSVVRCKDTPGFIANRLGVYWMQLGVVEAVAQGIGIEEADAVLGRPFGVPRTGVFGLIDLVGLDLMPEVNRILTGALPPDDPFHAAGRDLPVIRKLIAEGYTGRKGKGGFYRVNREGGGRRREVVDLATGAYRPERKAEPPELATAAKDLRALLSDPGRIGHYAWQVMGPTLAYAAKLVPEAADDIVAIDEAMRLGYNWRWGPFELIDRLGAEWFADRLRAAGWPVPPLLEKATRATAASGASRAEDGSAKNVENDFAESAGADKAGERAAAGFYRIAGGKRQYLGADGGWHDIVRPPGVLLLEDIKLTRAPLLKNRSAALWDIGDGVVCLEFTGKSNALDDQVIALISQAIPLIEQNHKALVIYNEGRNFSVGANLALVLFAANIAAWSELGSMVSAGQAAYRALKYARFPVVSAPTGMALGGGCEILLHSDAVQAHAETYAGLVETGVGLVPGWGGCKEMLTRWTREGRLPNGPMPAPAKVFEMVSTATVSKSAAEARDMLILRRSDRITMNRYRLLADAKARALELARDYKPPEPVELLLPGPSGKLAMTMAAEGFRKLGLATPHDMVVAEQLATVLSGDGTDIIDPVGEQQLLDLERESFLRLVKTGGTLARIEHMLQTGKPLRN